MEKAAFKTKKDKTIDKIMGAAIKAFSEKGFAGARVDEIALSAGVNKATIYYHIGDKKALYARVLNTIFSNVTDQIQRKVDLTSDPELALKQYVGTLADNIRNNPQIPGIMLHEVASGGESLPDLAVDHFARMFMILRKILQDGHDNGIFGNVNLLVVHFSALGALIFCTQMENTIRNYLNNGNIAADTLAFPENIVDSVQHTILKMVKAP
jgi:AcrR family transcriptional regulator